MSDVKRYDIEACDEDGEPNWDNVESPTGLFVLASDYDALAAELSAYKRVGSMMTGAAGQHAETVVELRAQLATANERLREADEIVRDLLECGCDDHREIARKWRVSYGAWLAGSALPSQSED